MGKHRRDYDRHELVWAKFPDTPWWPGYVISTDEATQEEIDEFLRTEDLDDLPRNEILVRFFQDGNRWSSMTHEELKPFYGPHYKKFIQADDAYRETILQAVEDAKVFERRQQSKDNPPSISQSDSDNHTPSQSALSDEDRQNRKSLSRKNSDRKDGLSQKYSRDEKFSKKFSDDDVNYSKPKHHRKSIRDSEKSPREKEYTTSRYHKSDEKKHHRGSRGASLDGKRKDIRKAEKPGPNDKFTDSESERDLIIGEAVPKDEEKGREKEANKLLERKKSKKRMRSSVHVNDNDLEKCSPKKKLRSEHHHRIRTDEKFGDENFLESEEDIDSGHANDLEVKPRDSSKKSRKSGDKKSSFEKEESNLLQSTDNEYNEKDQGYSSDDSELQRCLAREEDIRREQVRTWHDGKEQVSKEEILQTQYQLLVKVKPLMSSIKILGKLKSDKMPKSDKETKCKELEAEICREADKLLTVYFNYRNIPLQHIGERMLMKIEDIKSISIVAARAVRKVLVLWIDLVAEVLHQANHSDDRKRSSDEMLSDKEDSVSKRPRIEEKRQRGGREEDNKFEASSKRESSRRSLKHEESESLPTQHSPREKHETKDMSPHQKHSRRSEFASSASSRHQREDLSDSTADRTHHKVAELNTPPGSPKKSDRGVHKQIEDGSGSELIPRKSRITKSQSNISKDGGDEAAHMKSNRNLGDTLNDDKKQKSSTPRLNAIRSDGDLEDTGTILKPSRTRAKDTGSAVATPHLALSPRSPRRAKRKPENEGSSSKKEQRINNLTSEKLIETLHNVMQPLADEKSKLRLQKERLSQLSVELERAIEPSRNKDKYTYYKRGFELARGLKLVVHALTDEAKSEKYSDEDSKVEMFRKFVRDANRAKEFLKECRLVS